MKQSSPPGVDHAPVFLGLVLAAALSAAACQAFLKLDPPDAADSTATDATDSAATEAQAGSSPDGPDSSAQLSTDASIESAADASTQDENATDASAQDEMDASAEAPTDQREGGAPGDAACGVCTAGTTQACGTGGTQTCNARCQWSACSVPNTVGCSDQTRDGFVGTTTFPRIAGCLGDWTEGSMRAPKTGVVCGNSVATRCAVPADLCAAGWHVCGTPPYGPTDISAKITNAQCVGETTGAFAAALGDLECEPCSSTGFGAVCCGTPCIQQNGSCVWAKATPWVGVISGHGNLCSDVYNTYPTTMGALCCMD